MLRKKNNKKDFKPKEELEILEPILSLVTKNRIKAVLMFLVAVIFFLSFFNLAGPAGNTILKGFILLIGKTVFLVPILFVLAALIFLDPKQKGKILPIFLGIFIFILGTSGVLGTQNIAQKQGGWLGFLMAQPIIKLFGFWVANIIFCTVIIISFFVFFQFLWQRIVPGTKEKISLAAKSFKRSVAPIFKEKEIENNFIKEENGRRPSLKIKEFKEKIKPSKEQPKKLAGKYLFPPINLLQDEDGTPTSGDIKQNSIIIQKTLENFGIPVEMAEISIGPTVTQYTFRPAEGVKLSKITTLSNNLSLALAAHPIRIEAPIPGKALVGIEVPNKARSFISLRSLISNPNFQRSPSQLLICLGRDVSGAPFYTDLGDMPHMLVAGSTGSGKTIFLNTLILSLLYRNTPETLRIILIDPKRVEFQVYNNLPHLLVPVVYEAQKSVNVLQWLTKEMERRFEVFAAAPARDIIAYNKLKSVTSSGNIMPYVVLIVDELADLMAARGRDIEAGVVRLAQMARATGIHLVLATQRPSVEVITGLIKANVTARATFQVASQIDSRTVLDMAGAEKLLGMGDMLFISSKTGKPKRIQAVYVSEKETRRVADFIRNEIKPEEIPSDLSDNLKECLRQSEEEKTETFFTGEDPLCEEAKRVVIEAKKASASLLQRRLRIGYARAARLIDILEEKGMIGPGEGAKPREVYGAKSGQPTAFNDNPANQEESDEDNEWKKV